MKNQGKLQMRNYRLAALVMKPRPFGGDRSEVGWPPLGLEPHPRCLKTLTRNLELTTVQRHQSEPFMRSALISLPTEALLELELLLEPLLGFVHTLLFVRAIPCHV